MNQPTTDTLARNVADRRAAEALFATMADLIASDFHALPSDRSRQIFYEIGHTKFAAKLAESPACMVSRQQLETSFSPSNLIDELTNANSETPPWEAYCDEIEELAGSVRSAGMAFAEDVVASMQTMRETMEKQNRMTAKQEQALLNWSAALEKWQDF
jgi:hypothetical protein